MAKIVRVVVPGLPHHITQRGVRSMDIVFKPEDYEEFLSVKEDKLLDSIREKTRTCRPCGSNTFTT